MAKKRQIPHVGFADQLSSHIESLQEGFQKLTRAATLEDLADQFHSVIKNVTPGAAIQVVFRPRDGSGWKTIAGSGATAERVGIRLPRDRSSFATAIDRASGSLQMVQRLVDSSHIGLIVSRPGGTSSTDNDVITLRLFIHLFDNAYQEFLHRKSEKELVSSLNHRVLQLNSLIDTGIEVSKLDQDASPHTLALVRAASLTNASKATVRVTTGSTVVEEVHFPDGSPPRTSIPKANRISTNFEFGSRTYTFELYEKESRDGVCPFEDTDQLLLDALSRQVHASLENRYLHEQALEKQRIEQEMSVAASIQQRIIPASLPEIIGYDVAGVNIPSKSVGGDYYDCYKLPDGRFALIIADVAGKGMPAALLVSSLHAYMTAYFEAPITLSELAVRLNRVIYHASTSDKFITAFIALLTPETGEIESLNAGHNPSYLVRNDNTVTELKVGGIPLGMLDMNMPYESERVTLEKGERLLLYTDGITEAENSKKEFYENERSLVEFTTRHKPDNAEGFIKDLITDIRDFTGSAPQSDDVTALYLFRKH